MTMSISSAPASTEARDLGEARLERREPGGKPGRDRGHRDPGAGQRVHRGRHHRVVHAHRRHLDPQRLRTEQLQQVGPHRLKGLGTQAPHPPGGVITRQGGQIDERHGAKEPRCLPVPLDRPPLADRGRPALHGAAIDPHIPHPFELERSAGVPGRKGERRQAYWCQVELVGHFSAPRQWTPNMEGSGRAR